MGISMKKLLARVIITAATIMLSALVFKRFDEMLKSDMTDLGHIVFMIVLMVSAGIMIGSSWLLIMVVLGGKKQDVEEDDDRIVPNGKQTYYEFKNNSKDGNRKK